MTTQGGTDFAQTIAPRGRRRCGAVLTVAAPASAQLPDPAGDDGTIKIDDLPLDDLLDNEPHVGCDFQVDLYGYAQADDLTAQVTFEALAPTAGGEILTEDVDLEADLAADLDPGVIGEVPVGAGVALNASATFDLWAAGLADIEPHPEQGWHVKLTVHVAGGSIGADVKAKVFWGAGLRHTRLHHDHHPTVGDHVDDGP